MAKRPTAAEGRAKAEKLDAQSKRTFLSRLRAAASREEMDRIANDPSIANNGPGAAYSRWLGCALYGAPYDSAPRDVREAIDAAITRAKPRT
jgi:hypothetical protein